MSSERCGAERLIEARCHTPTERALGIDRAQPETYDIRDRTFPGYTLTFTTTTT